MFLRTSFRNFSTNLRKKSLPGIIFDIDGVLSRGGQTLPAALKAFDTLFCKKLNNFKIPIVFVTNAGNNTNDLKAKNLSQILGYPIKQEQVIMSHTPLQSLNNHYKEKYSLISGQGPIQEISKQLGFKNTISVDELRDTFPYFDMVNQSTRPVNPKIYKKDNVQIPVIEQIILYGEPKYWETHIQLILDCLITNGDFWQRKTQNDYETKGLLNPSLNTPQMPIIAANMDLQWQAEAPGPRLGHGMFLTCLESAYKKLTGGRELIYDELAGKPATLTYSFAEKILEKQTENRNLGLGNVYCIGDNLMSDITGANMYTSNSENNRNFYSMLVCTGVYHPESRENLNLLKNSIKSININHAPKDYQKRILNEKNLIQPDFLFEDVNDCVNHIFDMEMVDEKSTSKML
jgi:HAD superfamily hydrolase (TIGR01456 family)